MRLAAITTRAERKGVVIQGRPALVAIAVV
jgi:hypothetical protein